MNESRVDVARAWKDAAYREGLSEAELLDRLGEPAEAVMGRLSTPPAWMTALAQAYARADSSPQPGMPPGPAMSEFLGLVGPLIEQGQEQMRQGINEIINQYKFHPLDPDSVEALLLANLPGQLLPMLDRTLVLELNVARLQGTLPGQTTEERFRSFVARLRRPEVALALLEEYPVLARQLTAGIDRWVDTSLEFLRRLCADWRAMLAAFSPDSDPGGLVRVKAGLGDTHRGGRSVLIAQFGSGLQVVYKPRSLAVDVQFQEFLAWLNSRGDHPPFRMLKVLERGPYGWVEFVTADHCASPAEVRRFYERQGGYLALLYALGAADFHFENLIAAGEHPVLIDLESLLHPGIEAGALPETDRVAGEALADSVLRVGLLPQRAWAGADSEGVEISGLGAQPGQLTPRGVPHWEGVGTDGMRRVCKRVEIPGSRNRPGLNGAEIDVLDYVDAITSGFTAIYRLLMEHRAEFLADDGPLVRFADTEVRVILRNTQTYALLLRDSFHPDVLRDALDRDRLFDRLWISVQHRPNLARVIPAERHELWQGDIPMFTTRAGSCDLWSGAGEHIPDFFDEPSLTRARRRVHQLGETDLERQHWLIRASLTTLAMEGEPTHRTTAPPAEPAGPACREQLLAAARAVADRLDRLALRDDMQADAHWIGLKPVGQMQRHWVLGPLGLDLYDGVPGVALFLAYLGEVAGEVRYTTLARAAATTVRRQVARDRASITSIGGFDGWGGLIYVLAHLAALWGEPALRTEAEALIGPLHALIEEDEYLDIIKGAAGGIGGLLSLYRCTRSEHALAVAIRCGDWLIQRAQPQVHGLGWATKLEPSGRPLTGFSHGAAGMAWALAELAALTGEARFREAALAAITYERSLFSPEAGNWPDLRDLGGAGVAGDDGRAKFMSAWCHGAPGIGLARLRLLSHLDTSETRSEIDVALQTTLARGFGDNHSLCHGDLGNLELLLQAGQVLPNPQWKLRTGRIASMILESIETRGWVCGVPLGAETPGLMTGLAGIGYGLLRLARPEQVPSVLILEPPGPRQV